MLRYWDEANKYQKEGFAILLEVQKVRQHNELKISHYFCQAQPKLQVKHSLKAKLALFSINPATPTPHLGKFIFQHFSVNVEQVISLKIEDDLISLEMEDDLNSFENGRRPQSVGKMEEDLNF